MLLLKFLLIILISICWRLGGWDKAKWSGYRDVLVPIIIGGYYFFTLKWWIGLLTIATFQIIRLGYGAYDPEHDDKPSFLGWLTKDRQGHIVRGLYGTITSTIGPLLYIIYSKHYIIYILYIIGNTILEVVLTKMKTKDIVHEPLTGAGRASIILIC